MSDLLSIGASGVRAFQTALATTSENIANAATPGYARRTTGLAAVSSTTGLAGYGVALTGTERAADRFKAAAVRTAGTDLARTTGATAWLGDVQTALTGAGVGTRLTSFFAAGTALAADPSSTAQRQVMLEAATSLAAGFTATGSALAQVQADVDASADADAATLGALAQGLAKVNDGIGRAAPGSAAAATLADQRDELLERMSGLADITASFDAAGRASVKLGEASGPTLVAGVSAGTVAYARNADGATQLTVLRDGEASGFTAAGGSLAGAADANLRLAATRTALADTARAMVADVNGWQAAGRDLSGQPGAALFAADPADPTRITVALSDPAKIAAGAAGGARDGGNLSKLQALRASGGYEASVTGLVAANAAAIGSRKLVGEAQSAILAGATDARDAVSGVDLDTEAVNLIRFQQAYQASSKVIQIARDTMQTLLEIR